MRIGRGPRLHEIGEEPDVRFTYANEQAMRLGEPLPPSRMEIVLAGGIAIISAIAVTVALGTVAIALAGILVTLANG